MHLEAHAVDQHALGERALEHGSDARELRPARVAGVMILVA
jgi:hypothetical protein